MNWKTPAQFPILYISKANLERERLRSIPWAMIAPHEAQALDNHSQSLARLAERGGLSPCEALCAIEGRKLQWGNWDENAAEWRLRELVAEWEARHQSKVR